jgi:uncharacterized protein (TIGR02145 family)
MKKFFYFLIFAFEFASAQNVGIGTNTPNSSALLDVTSTSQGFLPPRMTEAQRNAIVNPAAGLIVYCTDCGTNGEWQGYNGTSWMSMTAGTGSIAVVNFPSFTTSCGQTWTTKNLSVRTYRNGDVIPQVTDATQWKNLTTGAWCWYNNDSGTYAATYGRLYNWYAVNDPRGLAPAGWHVPTDAEWNIFVKCFAPTADTTYTGSESATAGGAMKEGGTSHWASPNTGASNSSGFTGLPGGYRDNNGAFGVNGYTAYWWTSTENTTTYAWYRQLYDNTADVSRWTYYKIYGYSVRLVKD